MSVGPYYVEIKTPLEQIVRGTLIGAVKTAALPLFLTSRLKGLPRDIQSAHISYRWTMTGGREEDSGHEEKIVNPLQEMVRHYTGLNTWIQETTDVLTQTIGIGLLIAPVIAKAVGYDTPLDALYDHKLIVLPLLAVTNGLDLLWQKGYF